MKYTNLLVGLLFGIFTGYFLFGTGISLNRNKLPRVGSDIETRDGHGVLTNPLLECSGLEEDETMSQLNISRSNLVKYVQDRIDSGQVKNMSLYLRDLNNGPWVAVNLDEKFIGGSLLKVPVMIGILKKAQTDPNFLDQEISYDKENVSNDQYFVSDHKMQTGGKYKVSELLKFMINYSDNNAAYLLSKDMTLDEFDDVFESLGFGRPDPNVPFDVNVKTYAGFFRVLYNASYLNKGYSEKALELLTQVEFDKGLTRLIPKYVTVAHKFGIRTDGNVNQLHDCGIVYYPKHPYLICIMTKGGSFDNMADAIANVSGYIYQQVTKTN